MNHNIGTATVIECPVCAGNVNCDSLACRVYMTLPVSERVAMYKKSRTYRLAGTSERTRRIRNLSNA